MKGTWRHTIGALILLFPMFIATVLLLNPYKLPEPYHFIDFITSLRVLFNVHEIEKQFFEVYVQRNDLYFVIVVAFTVVIINNLIDQFSHKVAVTTRIIWYTLLISSFIIRRFIWWTFDMEITAELVSLISETNGNESSGFVATYILTWNGIKFILKAALIAIIIYFSELLWARYSQRFLANRIIQIVITSVILIMVPFAVKSMLTYNVTKNTLANNTINAVIQAIQQHRSNEKAAENFYKIVEEIANKKNVATCEENDISVIFVLGESFIKGHASIYGYKLPTTPYIDREAKNGNIIAFTNVITPFNSTTPSVKNMMCLNNLSHSEQWYNCIFWPQLFRKAGYETMVFDNQRSQDRHLSGSFYQMYSPKVSRACYSRDNNSMYMYDADMLPSFEQNINESKSKRIFAFIHLMGQHFPFDGGRYPKQEHIFRAKDIKRNEPWLTNDKKEYIATYDNAIRHTDRTLKGIFDVFRERNAVIVFISDHGEEVYDYRDKANRPPMDSNMKSGYAHCQHDIPFIIWMSDKYRSKHPEIEGIAKEAINKPYMHDRIGNMMLTLGMIKTQYYNAKDDILNSQYTYSDRIITASGKQINYDEICK